MKIDEFSDILKNPQQSSILDLSPEELKARNYRETASMLSPSVRDLSDEEILKIVEEVTTAFQEIAEQKDEELQEKNFFAIILRSIKVYSKEGETPYHELLKHEANRYRNGGLFEECQIGKS